MQRHMDRWTRQLLTEGLTIWYVRMSGCPWDTEIVARPTSASPDFAAAEVVCADTAAATGPAVLCGKAATATTGLIAGAAEVDTTASMPFVGLTVP